VQPYIFADVTFVDLKCFCVSVLSARKVSVKKNKYGYSPFTADLTEKITIGKNTVEVLADNSLVPNCRWYTGSGIYRPVYLEISKKRCPDFFRR